MSAFRKLAAWLLLLAALVAAHRSHAEDGYELWLRYHRLPAAQIHRYLPRCRELIAPAGTARDELERGLRGLLGAAPAPADSPTHDGAIVLLTQGSPQLKANPALLEPEDYFIHSTSLNGHQVTVVAAGGPVGLLYGVFHLLRLLQTHQPLDRLNINESPHIRIRMLNHWDNLDGSIERGYAGSSIWDWQKLPDHLSPRYQDYARACASIGINGTLLTNVNADAVSLSTTYLVKTAALAAVFRPYGIRVYLSARFSAPKEMGGLSSADPASPEVRAWWHDKVDEIYRLIPDFGGFVIKANSEGQPGPFDYGRSHADGANLFADVLAPHGGVVLYRAFVYGDRLKDDRAKQAYDEFKPLDGQFHANVIVQIKNGPIDFQPREPAHPLFGALPNTPVALELEITKEYLGFATHLVYLGPLFEEVLSFDTYAKGPGSTVASIVEGKLYGQRLSAIAGVANVGSDRNWTGSHFDQANWYVFGRLAWNPEQSSRAIAEEWLRMTFSNDSAFLQPALKMMMESREAAVNYMTPLGLTHLMAAGHHYGPGAWQGHLAREDWSPLYFHKADADGIGFDRTHSGSDAVAQYHEPWTSRFNEVETTPEQYLLWFHHLSWDYRLKSGKTLWEELTRHYTAGLAEVAAMRAAWENLKPFVDEERHAQVADFLKIQEGEARWWRDATLAYFASISHRPFPADMAAPDKPLSFYQSIVTPYAPGNPGWTAAPFRH